MDGMSVTKKLLFICCFATGICLQEANAQSLRGKVIYVSPTQEVMFKFKSIVTYHKIVNDEAQDLFDIRVINKNLSINSKEAGFKTQSLTGEEAYRPG